MRKRPGLRLGHLYEHAPEKRYPTDEEVERVAAAIHYEAGKSNDPKVQGDSRNPEFWEYTRRYALAALLAYLNPPVQ